MTADEILVPEPGDEPDIIPAGGIRAYINAGDFFSSPEGGTTLEVDLDPWETGVELSVEFSDGSRRVTFLAAWMSDKEARRLGKQLLAVAECAARLLPDLDSEMKAP